MSLPECEEQTVIATEPSVCRECRNPIGVGDSVILMVFMAGAGPSNGPKRHPNCPRTF